MDPTISVNVHINSDTRVAHEHGGEFQWLRIGESVCLHFEDENAIGEILGALDSLIKGTLTVDS